MDAWIHVGIFMLL